METTKLFFITFFAAFVGVVPPGLVNMSVAKTCIAKGKKYGVLMAIGAIIVVFFQALLAVLLARYIFDHPVIKAMLLRVGIVIFIIMSIYFFVQAKKGEVRRVKVPKNQGLKVMGKGAAIAAINVLPIPYFCALALGLNVGGTIEYDFIAIFSFVLGATFGTFMALYGYILGFARIQANTLTLTKYTNYFMGILMLILVLLTLWRLNIMV